jgi:hypothetical protein
MIASDAIEQPGHDPPTPTTNTTGLSVYLVREVEPGLPFLPVDGCHYSEMIRLKSSSYDLCDILLIAGLGVAVIYR